MTELSKVLSDRKFWYDKTLKDTLGMAYASLDYDSIYFCFTDTRDLGVHQTYSDALAATLTRLKSKPEHSYQFLEELAEEMERRGLSIHDEILTPRSDENYQAILRIVQADLENIEHVRSKPTSNVSDTRTAEEIVFAGIPRTKILMDNGQPKPPEKISQEQSIEYKCTVTKLSNKYYWTTRENVELTRNQSGIYTTFVAKHGSGYIQIIHPEMRKNLFEISELSYDYMEHLIIGLSTITYYGTSK